MSFAIFIGASVKLETRGNNESDTERDMSWLFLLTHGRIQNAAVILFHGQNYKSVLRKK